MKSDRERSRKRKQQVGLLTNIVLCLITLTALTGCIFLLLQNYSLNHQSQEAMARIEEYQEREGEYRYKQEDLDAFGMEVAEQAKVTEREAILTQIKTLMENGEGTAAMLRSFFKDDVVVYANNRYYFFPILDSLKKHPYTYENFVKKNEKEIVYVDDTNAEKSIKGIDVSSHQGKIDWEKVKKDRVDYAFIRAGYRGYSNGRLVEDENFKDNIEGALENHIEVGAYLWTQAVTEEEAVEEAEFLLELLKGYEVNFPVVLDLEDSGNDSARTKDMTQEEYTRIAIAFCDTIRDAGYKPMIYGNLKSFMLMLDLEQLEEYDKWFAYYNDEVYFPYDFAIWQYSSTGSVDGIKGDVDMNICMKEYLPGMMP